MVTVLHESGQSSTTDTYHGGPYCRADGDVHMTSAHEERLASTSCSIWPSMPLQKAGFSPSPTSGTGVKILSTEMVHLLETSDADKVEAECALLW
jgi:hypothetical protein